MLWRRVTLADHCWISSQRYTLALLRSWNSSKSFLQCKIRGQSHFFILYATNTFLIYVSQFTFTKCSPLVANLVSWTSAENNVSTVSYFFYNSIYIQFKFHFQQYGLLFLCCALIFVGQFPSSDYPLLQNMWVYHWETRREHNWTFCFLCMISVTGTQRPKTLTDS